MSFVPSPNDFGKNVTSVGSLGISMQLLIGSFAVSPAPESIMRSIKSVQVTNSDAGADGFQITFGVGREADDGGDYSIFSSKILKPFTRVVIIVRIGSSPRKLIDGFITQQQFVHPGKSTVTVTGEDCRIMMDMHEIPEVHIGQPDYVIVNKLILRNGLVPYVVPPPQMDLPVRRDPVQNSTDLQYILALARKYNYVFYLTYETFGNVAHWEPEVRAGNPQKAITVDMGPATNAQDLNFQYNALQPVMVFGAIQDEIAQNVPLPIIVPLPLPPYLSREPAHFSQAPNVRTKLYDSNGSVSVLKVYIDALAEVDASREVVTATGQLNTLRYGEVLRARKLVSLRGVGNTHDGVYYVKSVTHNISRGSYTQNFTLAREGTGSIISGVSQ